jgi:hypothetical protein
MALGMAKTELEKPGGPKAQWDNFMENPDNQRLVALLQEMGSQEFFIYADKRFADWLGVTLEAINAAQYAPAFNKLAGRNNGAEDRKWRLWRCWKRSMTTSTGWSYPTS